ncbi:MAG: DUF3891 family protein [Chloroflexi bacterium]|nr:DUF3891 family protein [Chloroflexota bacterium]
MIRRIESDGTILIITQPAHAWLSGQIAERWGNANFPTPEPREALLLAAYCHDVGWAEWEAMPRVRSDGRPPNFTEMEVDDQLANWRRGIRIANSFNSYAAMLVALHATALLRGRLAAASDPAETRNHIEMFLA